MVGPVNRATHLDELADVDVDTTPPATGDTLRYSAGVWAPGAPSSFDPDTPLDYFTMTDTATGDVVEVTITSGAWVLTTIAPLTTEGGDLLTTEGADILIAE